MKKTLQILNGVALIGTIFINYLSNTGIFNGETMSTVSAKYQNLFTPAGYAFSIWGLIYLGLLGFVIYYGRSLFKETKNEDDAVSKIGWWFIVSCICNSLWVIAWLYQYTFLSILLMAGILISLIKIILNTNMELHNAPLRKFLFQLWPFCIYAGWIAVALIANVAAYLTRIEWNGFGISETVWAVVMILVASVLNIFMIWNRNMREFALVGVWGLIAVAMTNKGENETVFWAAIVGAVIIFCNIGIHGYLNRKETPFAYKEA